MGAFYNNAGSRSGSFISGTPLAAKVYKNYSENFTDIIFGTIQEVAKEFEKEVKEQARSSWGDLADSIRVRVNPQTLTLDFEVVGPDAPDAEMLEYGTLQQSPRAVLRNAAVEANQKLPLIIEKRIAEKVLS